MAKDEAPKLKENVKAASDVADYSEERARSEQRTSAAMEQQLDMAQKLKLYQKELNDLREKEITFLKMGFGISEKIQKVKDIENKKEEMLQALTDEIIKETEKGNSEKLQKLIAQKAQLQDQNTLFKRQAFYLKSSIYAEEIFNTAALAVYESQDKIASALGKGVLELLKQRSLFGIIQTATKTILDFALAIDDEIVKQNRELNFSRQANRDLNELTLNIYKNNAANGLTLEDAVKSTNTLTKTFGKSVALTSGLAEDLSQLENKLGLSTETSAAFLDNMGAVSRDVDSASASSIFFAKQISKTSGVGLGDLMKEAADASGDLAIFSGQSGTNILKAAANAKLLGVSLNSFVNASSKSLQFQSSIQAELKASVLLGKNLNLQGLRRAAFNKDTLGVERELLNIIKRTGKSLKDLDPIQMQALADATGLTAEEMLKIENRRKLDKKTLQEIDKIRKESLVDGEKTAKQDALRAENLNQIRMLGTRLAGMLAEIVVPLIPQINRVMVGITRFFTDNKEQIQALGKGLVDTIVPALKAVAKFLLPSAGGKGPLLGMIQPGPWTKFAGIIAGTVLSINLLVKGVKGIGSAINATVVQPVKTVIDTAKSALDYGKKGINIFKGFRKGGIKGGITAAVGEATKGEKGEDKCCAGVSSAADSISTVAETMTEGLLGKQIGTFIARFLPAGLKPVFAGLFTSLGGFLGTSISGILAGSAAAIAGAATAAVGTAVGGYMLGGHLEEKYGLGTRLLEEKSITGGPSLTRRLSGLHAMDLEREEHEKKIKEMENKLSEKKARKMVGLSTSGELTPEQQSAINGLVEKFGEKLANLPQNVVQVEYSRFQQNSSVASSRGNKNQVSVMPQIN